MSEDESAIIEKYFAGVPFPKLEIYTVTLKNYWEWLVEQGCKICRKPPQIHHCCGGSIADIGIIHGKSQKNNDWLVLPLCENHHTGNEGLHAIGVRTWEKRFGSQLSHVQDLASQLSFDLLAKAGVPTCNSNHS